MVTFTDPTVEAVRAGPAGGGARVTQTVVQTVHQGPTPEMRVTATVVQAVTTDIVRRVRAPYAALQVVHSGVDGAMAKVTSETTQVVWTTGTPGSGRQRAWTFDLDGHTFYVLDLGTKGTLVYDLTTQQWSRFETEGFDGAWNFKNGFHWRDGGLVVGGFDGLGTLARLNPVSFLDDDWRPVVYEVRGVLPIPGTQYVRQYALRLVGSSGVLGDDVNPVLRMRFSDDRGETWSQEYALDLSPTNKRQRLEFRSLGAFTAPGRIFRLYDEGGVQFIGYVEADVGGDSGSPSA